MCENNCILSTAYWGNIQYFTKLLLYENVLIEKWETYPKQSFRNRCNIYGVNGIQTLNVPIKKGSKKNIVIKDIEISYDTNWQTNHFKSIESAYSSSPFFEFFADDLNTIYNTKHKYLLDLNLQILNISCEWLSIDNNYTFSNEFVLNTKHADYRMSIHPKTTKNKHDKYFEQAYYMQGFEQRNGFLPNLSIIDLIVNMGSEARSILFKSIRNK